MTTTVAHEVEERRGRRAAHRTMASRLAAAIHGDLERRFEVTTDDAERESIRHALDLADTERWPSERYRADPVAFVRNVLGLELTEQQEQILLAVRDHQRVAVASGHKVGKSTLDAAVALWFYATHEEARVIMSSVTAHQIDRILWREVRKLHRRARTPLGGELHELARSGLKALDFREIVGFTAREAEAVAGISGRHMLYILDEASGIGDDIAEAIEGNRAGGARILMTSNPTRSEGFFFDAFHALAATPENPEGVHCITISSEASPNVVAGRVVVPGLATREWVEEKRREWGEDSAMFQVRVQGRFVRREEGRVMSLHVIEQAEQRWEETPEEGLLHIGVDPAGEGKDGDESGFALKRGLKCLAVLAFRGLSADGHLVQLLGLLREYRLPGEKPRVKLDREGLIGFNTFKTFRAYLQDNPGAFELYGIRASERATRHPDIWDRQRDALWGNAAGWLRAVEDRGEGGAIPEDAKLAADLHSPMWVEGPQGRMKITPKKEIHKKLGRSPDRGDAFCLAVWDPKPWESSQETATVTAPQRPRMPLDPFRGAIDPYGTR